MSDLTTITQDFLAECDEDYVGLWSLVTKIRRAGAAEGSNILKTTLALLTPLLSDKKIVAGGFVRDDKFHASPLEGYEFHQWNMPPREVIAKIEEEWTKLGRDPSGGEIVWFTAAVGDSKQPTTPLRPGFTGRRLLSYNATLPQKICTTCTSEEQSCARFS